MTENNEMHSRLGLDVPSGWWPAPVTLKAYEAAGFSRVQVRVPARPVLGDPRSSERHALALRSALDLTGLGLVVHAPDGLMAGADAHDRMLEMLIDYAAQVGAETIVYHGAQAPIDEPSLRQRLHAEECSLRAMLPLLESCEVTLAIENLAPVYPDRERVCHDPGAVAGLVRRLGSSRVGMCFDLGHAHIAAGLAGCGLRELLEGVLDTVALFHVHDNLGSRPRGEIAAGHLDPLKLDLHMAPGAGTLPWSEIAPLLEAHAAPLLLEVHPMHRSSLSGLAVVMKALLAPQRTLPVMA